MADQDISALQAWVGKQESRDDVISPVPVAGLSATLDYPTPRAEIGEPLPPLWHWLYFLSAPTASHIGVDGHARRGGFLPPVALPRRMWAGSHLRFLSPLYVGDHVRRLSTIGDINHKKGASGDLVFVTLQHQVFRGDQLAIEEEQSLVYRQASSGNAPPASRPAPASAQWSREIRTDPVLLFRYSALTFNSHRIHYDRNYAMAGEGYGGLVVQGPLTATLLLDLLYRELPEAQVASFQFRGLRPLVDGEPIQLQGSTEDDTIRLWALDAGGALAMDASARLV